MDVTFLIYGVSDGVGVPFHAVGCTQYPEQIKAPLWIPLQTMAGSKGLRLAWVKWCLRFRRTLLDDSYRQFEAEIALLTNPTKLQRIMGEWKKRDADRHAFYHEFSRKNPELLSSMVEDCCEAFKCGITANGMAGILNDERYFGNPTEHAKGFKIPSEVSAFYARHIMMEAPVLCGLLEVRHCVADDLVLPDGRTWRAFAAEHSDQIRISEPLALSEDWDGEYATSF